MPVAYPFGFGLSYTTFAYTVAGIDVDGDVCRVTVEVKNTGSRAGRDVVQLYVTAPKGKLDKPSKELRAFAKTGVIAPGASEKVTLEWNVMDMASFCEKTNAWVLDKGEYTFYVATSASDTKETLTFRVPKARRQPVGK